jgi:hypothetical protein
MKEGFEVKVEGGGFGIKIFGGKGVFAKRIEKPRVAICPKCGEISLYIENPDGIESK